MSDTDDNTPNRDALVGQPPIPKLTVTPINVAAPDGSLPPSPPVQAPVEEGSFEPPITTTLGIVVPYDVAITLAEKQAVAMGLTVDETSTAATRTMMALAQDDQAPVPEEPIVEQPAAPKVIDLDLESRVARLENAVYAMPCPNGVQIVDDPFSKDGVPHHAGVKECVVAGLCNCNVGHALTNITATVVS